MNPESRPRKASQGGESVSAMILAAGLGTRLFPLTHLLAKPAVPFVRRPLIHYAIDLIAGLGTRTVVINLHHLPETVIAAVQAYSAERDPSLKNLRIEFSKERHILGTAGGVRAARDFLESDDIVVVNGKIYSELNLSHVFAGHREQRALATLVVVPRPLGSPFNPVRVGSNSRVLGFGPGGPGDRYTFTGIQIVKQSVVSRMREGDLDLVKDVYPRLLKEEKRVMAHVSERLWCECSTPARYLQGSLQALEKGSAPWMAKRSGDRARSLISGFGCSIGTGSDVRDTILWDRVKVGKNCMVRNAIICSGVRLPDGLRLSNAIVTPTFDPGPESPVRPVEEKGYLVWPLLQE